MAYLFSKLNPGLRTDGPETLKTIAAYMPLSQKPQYEQSAAGKALSYIPVVALFKSIFGGHDKYGVGEHILGERFLDGIQGLNVGRRDVPDDAIAAAQVYFSLMFGVRIRMTEDFDALDKGVDEYYKRPQTDDIPRAAVERAVNLKRTYYPITSYNQGGWDLSRAQDIPLVAPIPGIEYKTLMNGEVPGIGPIVNGIPQNPDFLPSDSKSTVPGAGSLQSAPKTTLPSNGELPAKNIPNITPASSKTPAFVIYSLAGVGIVIIGVSGYFAFKKN